MCEQCGPPSPAATAGLDRRRFLAGAVAFGGWLAFTPGRAAAGAGPGATGGDVDGTAGGRWLDAGDRSVAPARPDVAVEPQVPIVPRGTWGPDVPATGPVPDEPDVRFLLVHHTVNRNDYPPEQVVGILRSIHGFHTGERGWPDIAYNFLVDRFGTVYEGRTGSIDGAKAGDATGGSQGFAQLCAFIGDHSTEPPSAAAAQSMVGLLAWLAARHGLDVTATTTFVSRGSNRWPAGTTVTTPVISGHRDMSSTACPGDAVYRTLTDGSLAAAVASATGPVRPAEPDPTEPPPPEAPPEPDPEVAPVEPDPGDQREPRPAPPADEAAPSTTGAPTPTPTPDDRAAADARDAGEPAAASWPLLPVGAGALLAVAAGAGIVAVRSRRTDRQAPAHPEANPGAPETADPTREA